MPVMLINYDLNREIIRPNITKKIKDTFPTWAKLADSCYAVVTSVSEQAVVNALRPVLDDNDNIYVFAIGQPYAGFGPPAVNKWLDDNLSY